MQRALVTGAGGFVCSHIVAALLRAGYAVTALDQAFDADWRERFSPYSDRLDVLVTDAAHLPDMRVDVLIHGAAVTGSHTALGMSAPQHFRANIDPALCLMDWAATHVHRCAVFISSSAIYPRLTGSSASVIYDENAPGAPDSTYGVAKLAIEQLVRGFASQRRATSTEPQYAVIRLGSIYGPYERGRQSRPNVSTVAGWVSDAVIRGEIDVPDPDACRDWTYVEDVGAAAVALITADRLDYSVYNVTSGHMLTNAAIADHIRQHIPQAQVHLQPDIHQGTRGGLSNRRLFEATGFDAWTSLSVGIRQTVTWMRGQLARQERA